MPILTFTPGEVVHAADLNGNFTQLASDAAAASASYAQHLCVLDSNAVNITLGTTALTSRLDTDGFFNAMDGFTIPAGLDGYYLVWLTAYGPNDIISLNINGAPYIYGRTSQGIPNLFLVNHFAAGDTIQAASTYSWKILFGLWRLVQ